MDEHKRHSADDFGQSPVGSMRGLDPPMVGASSTIMLDGLVEEESGKTPPPPTISVRAVVIAVVGMLVLGLLLLLLITQVLHLPTTPQ